MPYFLWDSKGGWLNITVLLTGYDIFELIQQLQCVTRLTIWNDNYERVRPEITFMLTMMMIISNLWILAVPCTVLWLELIDFTDEI